MIETEDHGDVTLLRMAHGKASAFDTEFAVALDEALIDYEQGPSRAAVLTGSGTIFSAGVDLVRLVREGAPYIASFLPALDRVFGRLMRLEKPLVAAINGHAIAGGAVLACACDRRLLAAGKARFGVPELIVGVPFPALALEIVREAWPAAHLRDAIFTGRTYTVDECIERGLVDEVVEAEGLVERALESARALARIPARSFASTKRMLRAPALERVEACGAAGANEILEIWSSPEILETIRVYVERTIGK